MLDLGVFNLLLHMDVGVLTAKCISTVVATTVAYLGNRHLSFSHRARTGLARETSYFFAINIVVLLFSRASPRLVRLSARIQVRPPRHEHREPRHDRLGTIFRFWAYKRFVFLHPDKVANRGAELAEDLS